MLGNRNTVKRLVKTTLPVWAKLSKGVDSRTFIALFQQFQEKTKKKTFLHILCFEYKALFV